MPPRAIRQRWRIRRAGPEDFGAIAALEQAAFQDYRRASPASLQRSLRSRSQSVWVVDDPAGDRIVSLLVLWHFRHRLRVYDVATLPRLQGHGLGQAMMAHAEALARKEGCTWVSLEADPKEPGLVEWYLHQGYAKVARLPRYYHNGNAAVRMVKRVAR